MLLLRPKISESQFAELAKTQKGTVNHWCLSRANYPISSGRWKILTVWLSHLTKVPPGAGETFPCCLQTQTFPCGYMSGTEMSCAATYMNAGLVAIAFVKGAYNMPSLLAFLLFDDHFSLLHAAIMSLNSFINDNYCSEEHTV